VEAILFVEVKKEKRQQTAVCHLSTVLSAVQLNRVETLSVEQAKTLLNSSRGGLVGCCMPHFAAVDEHNSRNGDTQW
jgi:hypothetical protein